MPEEPAAGVSYAQAAPVTCPACSHAFTFDIWLIVDAAERPDLIDRSRSGTLHDVACPECGTEIGQANAPLLLYRPDAEPAILFSPARQTSNQQNQTHAAELVERLADSLAAAWQDDWLAQGLQSIPREMLPAMLSEDPETAVQKMAAGLQAEMARLAAEDPEAFRQLTGAAQQAAQVSDRDDKGKENENGEDEDSAALPLVVRAALEAIIGELQDAGLTIDSPEAMQAALADRPELHARLKAVRTGVWPGLDSFALLNQFVQARSWGESQQIVERHPELLGDETVALLDQLIGAARRQGDPDAARILEEHRGLLRRCYEAGIPRAFAEKMSGGGPDVSPELQPILQALTRPARSTDLPQREQLSRQALALVHREENAALWVALQINLGNSLMQNPLGDRAENLEQAIAAYRQTLEVLTRQAMPVEWATAIMNLAAAYYFRIRGDRAENQEQAIAAYHQALEVNTRQAMPVEWATVMMNLANAYSNRVRGDQTENLEQAIAAYQQALGVFTPEALPDYCQRTARGLTILCFAESRYADAIAPYRLAMRATENQLQASLIRSSKEVELGMIQGLPVNAAYALAKLGRLEEAVEALEAGRARLLAEALEANRRDLERLAELGHGDLLARYRAASERLAALQAQASQSTSRQAAEITPQRDFAALTQEIQAARGDLDAAIAAIRQVPGYEDFFLPPTFAKIRQAATPKAPMIYLAVTSAGGLALVVRPPQTLRVSEARRVSVEAIWLDGITEPQLREVVAGPASATTIGGYLRAYNGWRRDSGNEAARDAWHAALDATTHWLWDKLMGDVVRALTAQGCQQAVLVPTGLLALLPLHAAWTEDGTAATGRRYALDALALSYAPNAGALAAGLETAARVRPDGVLAVDNPDGSLVFSTHEVEAVLSYFPAGHGKVLRGSAAIRAAVLDQLTSYPVYHLSTHGWAGWDEPLQGGLLLAGGQRLTLADILDLRLAGARLAVLSACETGIPGTKLPDEVIGLPAGLLQAGVAGVVASLWSVNDLSTAMLMERFYRLWRENGLEPAVALRQAQIWLRDSTNREKAEYFRRDVPALAGLRMPAAAAAELYVDYALRTDPDARVFAHPFWWAAFSLTGV